MWKCSVCETENNDPAQVCQVCGALRQKGWICHKCGWHNTPSDTKCANPSCPTAPDPTGWICRKCGWQNTSSATKCANPSCLSVLNPTGWICRKCGWQNTSSATKCANPHCGTKPGKPLAIVGIAAAVALIVAAIFLVPSNRSPILPSLFGLGTNSSSSISNEEIIPPEAANDAVTSTPVSTPKAIQTFELSEHCIVTATEDFSAAIDQNGCVVLIGNNYGELMTHGEDYSDPQPYDLDVGDWRNVVEISGDQFHISGLMGSGRVISSGYDTGSGYVSGVQSWQNITQIRTGYLQTLGLTKDGRILFAGWYKGNYHVYDCTEWTNVKRIIGGAIHVAAIMSDGSVMAAGYNADGRCDTSTFRHDVKIVDGDLGAGSTFVVYDDGTVDMLGSSTQWRGSVLGWSGVVAISANEDHVVGLRENGQVFFAGDSQSICNEVESWENIVAVAAGPHHVVGICEDGTMVAAGKNSNGQCDVNGIDLWDNIAINPRQTFRRP